MKKSYVYYLYSSLDPEGVRYVGKTNNPKLRFWYHINDRRNSKKSQWVQAIGPENVSIFIDSEHTSEDECFECEIRTIARLRALGCDLTNASDGGEGSRGPSVQIKELPPMKRETLTNIRRAEKLTIGEMADKLGISRNTLSIYEKGVNPIPRYIALAVTCIYRRLETLEELK